MGIQGEKACSRGRGCSQAGSLASEEHRTPSSAPSSAPRKEPSAATSRTARSGWGLSERPCQATSNKESQGGEEQGSSSGGLLQPEERTTPPHGPWATLNLASSPTLRDTALWFVLFSYSLHSRQESWAEKHQAWGDPLQALLSLSERDRGPGLWQSLHGNSVWELSHQLSCLTCLLPQLRPPPREGLLLRTCWPRVPSGVSGLAGSALCLGR